MIALFFEHRLGTIDVCPAVGGYGYQIMIDGKYQGNMDRDGDSWMAHLVRGSKLTQADIDSLGAMLDEPESYTVKIGVVGDAEGDWV